MKPKRILSLTLTLVMMTSLLPSFNLTVNASPPKLNVCDTGEMRWNLGTSVLTDKMGSAVYFGRYYQDYVPTESIDSDTSKPNFGSENISWIYKEKLGVKANTSWTEYVQINPIEWYVLDLDNDCEDADGNSEKGILLLSKEILDVEPMLDTTDIEGNDWKENIKYGNSTMRSWLNGYSGSENLANKDYTGDNFYDIAFSSPDVSVTSPDIKGNSLYKQAILTDKVDDIDYHFVQVDYNQYYKDSWYSNDAHYLSDLIENATNLGTTHDKVFLPSVDDMNNTEYGFAEGDVDSTGTKRVNVNSDNPTMYSKLKHNVDYHGKQDAKRQTYNTYYTVYGGHAGYKYRTNPIGGVDDNYWLRSKGAETGQLASQKENKGLFTTIGPYYPKGEYVENGLVNPGAISYKGKSADDDSYGVRPMINLKKSSILFTEQYITPRATQPITKEGGYDIKNYTLNENSKKTYHLTLLDESRNFNTSTDPIYVDKTGEISLNYTGAVVGDREYISTLIVDENNNILYRGWHKQLDEASDINGTVTWNLPSTLDYGKYTLKVFNEHFNHNPNLKTIEYEARASEPDYGSSFVDIPLNVTNLALNTNGGTIDSSQDLTHYEEGSTSATTLPTDITREGYEFAGWYENANLTGSPVTSIPAGSTGMKTYYAKWTETVTFEVTGTEHAYEKNTERKITLNPKSTSGNLRDSDFTVKYYKVDQNSSNKFDTTPVERAVECGKYLYVIDFKDATKENTYKIEKRYTVSASNTTVPDVTKYDNIGFMYIDTSAAQQKPISFKYGEVSLKVGDEYNQNTLTNENGGDTIYTSSDSNVATVGTDGKVTAIKPGTVTITAESKKSGMTSVYASYKITIKKELTSNDINVTTAEKTYDGSKSADVQVTVKSSSLADSTDVVGVNFTAEYTDANSGNDKKVSWTVTSLYGKNADKYILADSVRGETSGNIINKAKVTIISSETTTRTYDGSEQTVDVSAMANGKVFAGENFTVMYKKSDESNASATPPKAVGEYTISIALKDAYTGNYEVVQPNAKLIIKSAKQDVFSIEIDRDVVYYGDSFELSNSGANGTVTYSVTGEDGNATDIATLNADGKTVTANKTGKIVITAESELAGYDKRTATKTIEIRKRVLTPTATAENKTYDGKNEVTVKISLDNIANIDKVTEGENTHISATAKGSMANADAGSGKIVYVKDFTLNGDKANYYTLSSESLQTTVTVNRRNVSISNFESEGKTYDGTPSATVKTLTLSNEANDGTGLLSADKDYVKPVGSAKFSIAGDGIYTEVSDKGTHNVVYYPTGLSGSKADNYELAMGTVTAGEQYEIKPMPVTFTIGNTSFVYDGNGKNFTASAYDENGKIFKDYTTKYYSVKDGRETLLDGENLPTDAGNYKVEFAITNSNYATSSSSDNTAEVTITNASQDSLVIVGLPGTISYKQSFDLEAVGGAESDNESDISYTWSCEQDGITIANGNTATPTITVNGSVGDRVEIKVTKTVTNYKPAETKVVFIPSPMTVSFELSNLTQTYGSVSAVGVKAYDGTNEITLSDEDIEITYNGVTTLPTNAGSYTVKAVTKNDNYTGSRTETLVINQKTASGIISMKNCGYGKYTYGDIPSAVTSVNDGLNVDDFNVDIKYSGTGIYVPQSDAPTNVGSYMATATFTHKDGNYAPFTAQTSFSIDKAELVVKVKSTTATRQYGKSNPVFELEYTGFKFEDNADSILIEPVATVDADATTDVGEYPITLKGGSAENYKFDFTQNDVKLKITPITTGNMYITGAGNTQYVNDVFTLHAYYGNTKVNATWSLADDSEAGVVEIGENGQFTAKKSGTAKIIATADKNYNGMTAEFTLTVKKTEINLVPDSLVKTYTGDRQDISFKSYDGFTPVIGENVKVTYTLKSDSKVNNPVNVGEYSVVYTIDDDRYTGGGTATMYINKADIVAKAKDDSKVYGNVYTGYDMAINPDSGITNEEVLAGLLASIKEGTTYTCDGAPASAPVKDGGYDIIPTTTFTGNNNVNVTVEKGILTVNKASLTIAVKNVTREYGAENPTLEAEYTGFVNNETTDVLKGDLELKYDDSINSDTAVGNYTDVTHASGVTADNYDITFADGDVEITKIKIKASEGVSRATYLTINFDKPLTGLTSENFEIKNGDETVVPTSIDESDDGKTYTLHGTYTIGTEYTVTISHTSETQEIVEGNPLKITPKKPSNTGGGGGGGAGGGGSISSVSYTVTFETNGGSKIDSVKVEKNKTVAEPTAPTKDGYVFDGWYADKKLTTEYDFTSKVTKAITLYAKWNKDDSSNPTPSEWRNPFTDVTEADWFFDNVRYANENGLMSGTTDTTFAPDESLTRGMLVTVLYRAEGEPAVNKSIPFSDVKASQYYANAVNWAQQNGIVNGVNETEFAPDENITREQIATIIYRYAEFKGIAPTGAWAIKLDYADVSEISDYALDGVMYCTMKNIMQGKENNTFAPKDNATRAEIAAILNRFIEGNK